MESLHKCFIGCVSLKSKVKVVMWLVLDSVGGGVRNREAIHVFSERQDRTDTLSSTEQVKCFIYLFKR